MNNSKCVQQFLGSGLRASGTSCWVVFLALLWHSSSPPMAGAAQFTFDDLTPPGPWGYMMIPSGYGGIQWQAFWVQNAYAITDPSGYLAGMISPSNVLFNTAGDPAEISRANPFDLNSAYITAAWRDGLQLEVRGYVGLTLTYDNTYTLSATTPSLIEFNYFGVTSVDFITSGGTPHPGYGGVGTQFVMDNLTVTIVPEPSSVVLLTLGMLGWRKLKNAQRGRVMGET